MSYFGVTLSNSDRCYICHLHAENAFMQYNLRFFFFITAEIIQQLWAMKYRFVCVKFRYLCFDALLRFLRGIQL